MLPGSKNRIQEHIKDAALFVLSSDYEGIPNALIEAMAIGLPCVSTDCSPGGARELINDGENGVIVDCGNSDALAKAMVLLLEDREKAQKMGINAKKICRRVDKELVCKRWMTTYGCVVLQNACVQNGASVGNSVLLNAGTEIHCDAAVGDYALIYTNSVVRTGATVGNFARIGSNCTICNNATVLDGTDIPDCTAVH